MNNLRNRKTITLPKPEDTKWAEQIHRHKALQARRAMHDEIGDLCTLEGPERPPVPPIPHYEHIKLTPYQAFLLFRNIINPLRFRP